MKRSNLTAAEKEKILAELHRDLAARQTGYRERALKIMPHICARCGRAFEGKRLKELTVHHRDHNHDNNPPDGSNWELLCTYCHEHEHSKLKDSAGRSDSGNALPASTFNPFADLKARLEEKNRG